MKNKVKIILVALVVVLVGYVYLMGGPMRTMEQVLDGNYLNFNTDSNNEYVDVRVNIKYQMFQYSWDYTTKISMQKWKDLNNLPEEVTKEQVNNIISKYTLHKDNDSDNTKSIRLVKHFKEIDKDAKKTVKDMKREISGVTKNGKSLN